MAMLATAGQCLHISCPDCTQNMPVPATPPPFNNRIVPGRQEIQADSYMATELHDCLVSSTDVPIGYAVLDTACLTSCGGGQTIDKYV